MPDLKTQTAQRGGALFPPHPFCWDVSCDWLCLFVFDRHVATIAARQRFFFFFFFLEVQR